MPKSPFLKTVLTLFVALPVVSSQLACLSPIVAVREMAAGRNARQQEVQTSRSSKNPKPARGELVRDDRPFAATEREILDDWRREDFDAIDRKAGDARRSKERFAGGYWKLKIIYEPLTQIFTDGGAPVTEEMWAAHLERLRKWKRKSPQSITARVALAQSWIKYGWFARGSGYSGTVAGADADKLHERLELAYNELIEAENLADKCPQWYESMLFLAQAQGWSAPEYEGLFETAVRFEPNYYYYYYDKGTNSLPRWGGRRGDWEKFAVELETLDSPERDIIYFLYVSNMVDSYYDEWTDRQAISWERCKRGYKQLEATFGTDKQRLNQYAFLASVNEDMPEAYAAFQKIGDDWDDEVFSEKRFYEIKNWTIARYEAENRR